MNEQTIDVVLMSWPNHPVRLTYFIRMFSSLVRNLTASRHPMRFLCSSETERDPKCKWCGSELETICKDAGIELKWHEGPASLGAGMNAAIRACSSPIIFLVQDDYELLEPLDLSPGADLLLKDENLDMIRYSYPPKQYGIVLYESPYFGFHRVSTHHAWCYGDDPQLRHKRMIQRYGWYREGIGHASEGDMVQRLASQHATILAPDHTYFGHFGTVSAVPEIKEKRRREVGRSQA